MFHPKHVGLLLEAHLETPNRRDGHRHDPRHLRHPRTPPPPGGTRATVAAAPSEPSLQERWNTLQRELEVCISRADNNHMRLCFAVLLASMKYRAQFSPAATAEWLTKLERMRHDIDVCVIRRASEVWQELPRELKPTEMQALRDFVDLVVQAFKPNARLIRDIDSRAAAIKRGLRSSRNSAELSRVVNTMFERFHQDL